MFKNLVRMEQTAGMRLAGMVAMAKEQALPLSTHVSDLWNMGVSAALTNTSL